MIVEKIKMLQENVRKRTLRYVRRGLLENGRRMLEVVGKGRGDWKQKEYLWLKEIIQRQKRGSKSQKGVRGLEDNNNGFIKINKKKIINKWFNLLEINKEKKISS